MRSPSVNGRIVHAAIFVTLFFLGLESIVWLVLFALEAIYLFHSNKRLLFLSLIFVFLVSGSVIYRHVYGYLPVDELRGVVVKKEPGSVVIRNGLIKRLVYVGDDIDCSLGDKVLVKLKKVTIAKKTIPHAFDYEKYLLGEGISGVFSANELEVTGSGFVLAKINEQALNYLRTHFPSPASEYLGLFILGESDELERVVSQSTIRLGIRHLFALSGMHLALIVGFLGALLKRLYLNRGVYHVLIVLFLVFYNLITAFRVSLVRASLVMIACFIVDGKMKRLSRLDCLSLVYLAMVVYNPFYRYSLGFQLTFAMTFVLFLGQKKITGKTWFGKVLKTTVLLNLCLLPVLTEASGGLGVMFIPANLVFITIISFVVLPLSFITLLFPLATTVYVYVVSVFESMVLLSDRLNVFIEFNFPSDLAKVLYFIGFLVPLCFPKKKPILFSATLIVLAFAVSFLKVPFIERVKVFAIGQGDSVLIEDDRVTILIDTGPPDQYDTLINYFQKENIHKIDLLVITHWHEDHYGELRDLVRHMPVDTIVAPSIPEAFIDLDIVTPKAFAIINCGNYAFQVLNACGGYENENNNSLVLYGKIGSKWWLFMGDAEACVEENITKLDLDVDIVKVGHHGSDTASTPAFVAWCDPEYALISVGRNDYGLPDQEVLSRWERVAKVFTTATDGTITFTYHPLFGCAGPRFYNPDPYRFCKYRFNRSIGYSPLAKIVVK